MAHKIISSSNQGLGYIGTFLSGAINDTGFQSIQSLFADPNNPNNWTATEVQSAIDLISSTATFLDGTSNAGFIPDAKNFLVGTAYNALITRLQQLKGEIITIHDPLLKYTLNARVRGATDSKMYKSLINNNQGNVPESTPLSWELVETSTLINTVYAVNSAKVDANGRANFINKIDNTTISFDTNSGATPIKITHADGIAESNTSLPNITGITVDGTYCIIRERNVNPYHTTLFPVEQYIAPVTPATNQLWLDISTTPYIPKKWNGTSWIVTYFVKLGEFTRTAGVIGTPISYALNGVVFLNPSFPAGTNTDYTYSTNIGSENISYELLAKCITAEFGYVVSQITNVGSIFIQNATVIMNPSARITRNAIIVRASSSGYGSLNIGAGVNVAFTPANWNFFVICKRIF